MRVEPYVTVRPWPKAFAPLRAAGEQPLRCYYFMGLKKKAFPAQPGGARATSVNLNDPVQEFKQQVLFLFWVHHAQWLDEAVSSLIILA